MTNFEIEMAEIVKEIYPVMQEKSVIPTKETQNVLPDNEYYGLSNVVVSPIPDNYVEPSGNIDIRTNGEYEVKDYVNANVNVEPVLQDKTVRIKPFENVYIHPDENYDGLAFVNAIGTIDTEDIEITPTKEIQNISRSEGKYIENVKVNAIPDEYIVPTGELEITENGSYDVTENASVNVDIQPNVASKTITENGTYNASDEGLDGYSNVEVETSGVDINDYFNLDYTNSASSSISNVGYWLNMITKLPKLNSSNIALNGFFRNFKGSEIEGVEDYDTKQKPIMQYTFGGCTGLTSLNLNKWDMSKGTTINYMFYGCTKLEELLINEWEVGTFTDINSMFYNCSALTSLDLSKWNLQNISVIDNLFYGCKELSNLKLPTFNFNKIKSLFMIFHSCSSLTELDIKNWDTSLVTNMNSTFMNCSSLIELDLSGWNTSNVTNMGATFLGCTSLQKLDIRNFDFSKVTNSTNLFGRDGLYVPTNCEIIVKDDTTRNWVLNIRNDFTNVKTVAELGE